MIALARKYQGNTNRRWRVRCDCGTVKVVFGMDLKAGRTRSCGCGIAEANKRNPKSLRHGHSRRVGSRATPEYNTWVDMLRRCDPKRARPREYKYWAGRDIKVCRRWLKFENFLVDMGQRPHPSLTIDRINNNGNYTKKNCRWATKSEQRRNQRPRRKKMNGNNAEQARLVLKGELAVEVTS